MAEDNWKSMLPSVLHTPFFKFTTYHFSVFSIVCFWFLVLDFVFPLCRLMEMGISSLRKICPT
uniref:Uncharacterized protein n=1 Tax=Arundo donax TaxID=35708 RepID=A0A0A9EK35_ARUDO